MAGLYLHIPFCKQACHYCNFHFSTVLRSKPQLLEAMLKELNLQRDYLSGTPLSSIYLGGGTPSLLDLSELTVFFERIYALFGVLPEAEITLEANPDDLTADKLRDLRRYTPVNRLSLGIQSFFEEDLRWMNRAHDARQARRCVPMAIAAGFERLTIDLIYGLPEAPDIRWEENVRTALSFQVPHFSCYALTVEEGTALAHFIRKGKCSPVDEACAARQFEYLMEEMEKHGYEHYEISNFARPGHWAVHNSSYWLGQPYLGIGPSAHSFDGVRRQWNVANNARYIQALQQGQVPFEYEVLTPAQRYNEYVMTRLRTIWGCRLTEMAELGGEFSEYFEKEIRRFEDGGHVEMKDGCYRLTRRGKLMADHVASSLFWVE